MSERRKLSGTPRLSDVEIKSSGGDGVTAILRSFRINFGNALAVTPRDADISTGAWEEEWYPSEGSPFPWIVSDFSLVDAIESGITKIPRLPAIDNTGRPDPKYFRLWEHVGRSLGPGDRLPGGKPKPEAVYREAEDALLTLAGEWKERFEQLRAAAPGQERTPPVMIVVCDNTDVAMHLHRMISGETLVEAADENGDEDDEDRPAGRRRQSKPKKRHGMGLPGFPELWNESGAEVTLRIDSKLLAAAESEDPRATRKDAAEELRRIVSTVGTPGKPGEHIRCVVSLNMLSEGWDADNVTHILGLRAFHSQLLCEQVVGRGLRRMDYVPDPESGLLTEEYVDVFSVPFSLIPFKGREPGGKAPPEDRPKHEVMALPERRALEIRFPVVEGYVASLRRHRIACDLDSVERTSLDPWSTPTAVFVRPQVGYQVGHPGAFEEFGFEEADRQQYYDSVHPQTIEFAIAGEITRELTEASGNGRSGCESRQVLFPQVLRIVQDYIRERVDLNGLHACDVGLQTYAMSIVGLLTAAIVPDESRGERSLAPVDPLETQLSTRSRTISQVQVDEALIGDSLLFGHGLEVRDRILIQANRDLLLHAPGIRIRRRFREVVSITHREAPRTVCVHADPLSVRR